MRLGQLARKLGIRPTEILEFLVKQNNSIESGSNAKLSEDQIRFIVQHFSPSLMGSILDDLYKEAVEPEESNPVTTETVLEVVEASPMVVETPPIAVHEIEKSAEVSLNGEQVLDNAVSLSDEEVIRAPKIELPGLKVLGKIDIPEPKKKEVLAESQETIPEEQKERPAHQERKDRRERRDARKHERPRQNPIAVKREREAQEAEEKKKEAAKLEKERRTLHYMKKVKVNNSPKSLKYIDEPMESKRSKQAPTSWWGRLKNWFKS